MIRNFDQNIWHQIRTEARRHDMTAGALLTLIAQEWLADHQCAAYGGSLEHVDRES